MYINVNLRKLLRVHKSHARKTSLFTGAIPNQVRNSQTSRFVSVPGQNPGRSSGGDSVGLWLLPVLVADVSRRSSRIGMGQLEEFGLKREWKVAEESASGGWIAIIELGMDN